MVTRSKSKHNPIPAGTYSANTVDVKVVKRKGKPPIIQHIMGNVEPIVAKDTREYTGNSVSYYRIPVVDPTTPKVEPYVAECNDIIESLGLNYAEGNVLKAIWRIAAARKGLSKRGYTDGVYDAEKIVFFGNRILRDEQAKAAP